MSEINNAKSGSFINMLKWFAIGWVVTFVVFRVMVLLKVDASVITTCFQTASGIFLGGLLQARGRVTDSK